MFGDIGSLGVEPRYVGSKPTVLPLDELPVFTATAHQRIERCVCGFGDHRFAIEAYELGQGVPRINGIHRV